MIIGHRQQWDYLKRLAESGEIPHAFLFCGPAKLGKKTMALEWASFLLEADISRKIHPDFILTEPEPPEDDPGGKKEIRISKIRDLIWRISLKSSVAPFKVAVINECHLMNIEAQNSFLKTLEEPKGKTVLILIADYPEILLPTIRSRCEVIKFRPVPRKEIEDYLEKSAVDKKNIQKISAISRGRPGAAVDFMSDRQKLKDWDGEISKLAKLSDSSFAARFACAKELAERSDLQEVLEIWLSFFREKMIEKIDDSGKLKTIILKLQNTIFLLSSYNINQRLALEALMLDF